MSKKDDFKVFMRNNSNLVSHVLSGEYTWQNLYEIYDIYGESSSVWNKFKDDNKNIINDASFKTTVGDTSLKDLFNIIKKIDLESVKKGTEGLQKVITLVQDIAKPSQTNTYQARPLYQHFED